MFNRFFILRFKHLLFLLQVYCFKTTNFLSTKKEAWPMYVCHTERGVVHVFLSHTERGGTYVSLSH